MHKVVMIGTHGVTIVEGTQIHCMAAFNTAYVGDSNPIAVYLYNECGQMIDINFFIGVADKLHDKFKRQQEEARIAREAEQEA